MIRKDIALAHSVFSKVKSQFYIDFFLVKDASCDEGLDYIVKIRDQVLMIKKDVVFQSPIRNHFVQFILKSEEGRVHERRRI